MIINAISKLHFNIVSAFSFIFLSLCLLFILLQNGLYIENISLPNLQVKKLYIRWNEKLNISIEEAKIVVNSKGKKKKITTKEVDKLLKTFKLFDHWFEKVEIKRVYYNGIQGSFKYIENQNGYITLSSKEFLLESSLFFESGYLNAKIDRLHDYKRDINIDGNIIFNPKAHKELIASLNIDINSDIKLTAYVLADEKKLSYKINSKENIKNIKHTIEMLNMPKEVKYWVYDAIEMSDAQLKYAYGWIDYNRVDKALKNLHVLVDVNKLKYSYNPELEPVITKNTLLEFKDGILFIRPNKAYQYGFYLNKSWLKIDFTKKEELLTLYLLFKGKVNRDLLHLLNLYEIKLPFLQNSGSVDTDLKISVGLRNIDVKAKGKFFTKKANFNYLGLNIDIFNAQIFLDNYDVTINNMHSKYEDIAVANVNVAFDTKKQEGIIEFDFKDIEFKDIGLNLKKTKTPLKVYYTIFNKQDTIGAKSSTWVYKDRDIHVDRILIPFNLKTLVANIPTTHFKIDDFASAYASGKFYLNPIRANIDINLVKFNLNKIKMNQPTASLKVKYDKKIRATSNESIIFNIDNLNYKFANTSLELENEILKTFDTSLDIKNLLTTEFSAKYDFKKK